MNAPVTFETCLQPVDQALSRLPGVSGDHFTERAASAVNVLPEELAQPLRELLALYQQLQAQPAPDEKLGLEFCFACGALTEFTRRYAETATAAQKTRATQLRTRANCS